MKILVLGAGGMLGHKIYLHLKDKFETWALTRADYSTYTKFGIFDSARFVGGVDVDDEKKLIATLDQLKPGVLINCIGVTTRKIDPVDSARVVRINALLPHLLYGWSARNNARLIHFSTDCVFSGEAGPYDENAKPDASDLYGRSKLMGEVSARPALTLRSSIIGHELNHHTELVEWLIQQRGGKIKGFSKVIYSGVTTGYMAYLVEKILHSKVELSGVYQFGSPPVSKFDLLQRLNQALALGIKIENDSSKNSDKSLVGNRLFEVLKDADKPSWDQMISQLTAEHDWYLRSTREGLAG